MTDRRKPIRFHGSALAGLRSFPDSARQDAGFQLDQVQLGHDPDDWRSMKMVGKGVREIRIRESDGAYRVIYVARFADAIHVLHCFQKKSQRTARQDLELAQKRYRRLVQEQEQD
ncbi:MAG: type II toxin-antitoxin system RelE/ParE family toxin [Xanthomonadales bacterium]|nr:type II toxin-antitoxin system RelE/ParE family toxin [Xanthomonadales bacterium]